MDAAVAPMRRWVAVALLLLIATTFSANHIAARLAFDHGINVLTAVAVRSSFTTLGVLLLLRATGVSAVVPAATARRAMLIGLLLSVQSFGLYSAVARIPVALALLTFNTFPFLLALLSWAAGGERPARRTMVAMVVALVGLSLALDVAGRVAGDGGGFTARWAQIGPGVGFALLASSAFACVLYLTTRWLGALDGRVRTVWTMGVVAAVTVAVGAGAGQLVWPAHPLAWTGLVLLTVLYGSAFTALFVVLPRIGAVNNAALLNFEPIASLGLGWLILDQVVAPVQVLGAFIVISAIVALSLRRG